MSEHQVEIDIDDPAAIFAEQRGEARIDENQLAAMTAVELATFMDGIKSYPASHPKLEVQTLIHRGAVDELVIRWRWRG